MVHVRTATLTEAGGTVWRLSDRPPSGDAEWIVTDVAGWYGGSGVRGDVTARLGHGDAVERRWREGRVLTLHGTVLCRDSDVRDDVERAISGMAWDGDWADLTCDDGHAVLSTRVRIDAAPQVVKVGTKGLKFQLPLRSDSPFLTATPQRVSVAAAGTGVGLVYPLYAPGGALSYGALSEATVGVLTNTGNAEAWPVFWVRGEMPTGFRVHQDGRVIEWNGSAVNVPVAVDTARAAVEIYGSDLSELLSRDDFAPVPPGGSVSVRFEPLGGGSGFLEAVLAPTYM